LARDLIATPADLAELETLVAYCVAHRLPITVRGAGPAITDNACRVMVAWSST
jgi:FAD/FMN-containing dehydrogenase